MNKYTWIAIIGFAGFALAAAACENTSGLDEAPRATFAQLACLDVNNDDRINGADGADPSLLSDFNADDDRDAEDAAFVEGIDIPLDSAFDTANCEGEGDDSPEYLVAHGYFSPSDVSCDDGEAVLLVGVGGGVQDLRDPGDASGVRQTIDALQKEYDDNDVQTIGVIAGQSAAGAMNAHDAMQAWLANVVRVYSERYPCIRTVLVGHSHGGVTVEGVASAVEGELGDRMIVVVDVDRIEELYVGGMVRPTSAPVFNIFETNDAAFNTGPNEAANFENWDASAEEHDGEPVIHTSIDNAEGVRERIVAEVMERS